MELRHMKYEQDAMGKDHLVLTGRFIDIPTRDGATKLPVLKHDGVNRARLEALPQTAEHKWRVRICHAALFDSREFGMNLQ